MLLGRTLLVMAHPDDEAVGAGALLQRMAEPIVVFCTDGAPRDHLFWGRHGSRSHYARLREEEARQSLVLAGVSELLFLANQGGVGELFVDQELHLAIAEAMVLLGDIVRRYRPQALLTLAYEGGHPDHDVCSFLTSVLGHQYRLPVWEFPLYHRQHESPSAHDRQQVRGTVANAGPATAGELVYQRFVMPSLGEEALLEITPDELEHKGQMLAAYHSQQPFLSEFDPRVERFRRQHAYDYSQPPHGGMLNYEAWQWPITARQVCAEFVAFRESRRRRAA